MSIEDSSIEIPQSEAEIVEMLNLDKYASVHQVKRGAADGDIVKIDEVEYHEKAIDAAVQAASDQTIKAIIQYKGLLEIHNNTFGHGGAGGSHGINRILMSCCSGDLMDRIQKLLLGNKKAVDPYTIKDLSDYLNSRQNLLERIEELIEFREKTLERARNKTTDIIKRTRKSLDFLKATKKRVAELKDDPDSPPNPEYDTSIGNQIEMLLNSVDFK